jgi:PTH1 family peptidyl-tRNA hydrolase
MSIGLIVGLGNPGPRYQNTRHNVGFHLLEAFAHSKQASPWRKNDRFNALVSEVLISGAKVQLMKPLTFMNRSGFSVGSWVRYFDRSASEIIVVYDDLTLDFARSKLSTGGSAGGHNGVADILTALPSNDFLRFRLGIGNKPHKAMPLADYVLSQLSNNEQQLLAKRMDVFCDQLDSILLDGPDKAMNSINQKTISSNE